MHDQPSLQAIGLVRSFGDGQGRTVALDDVTADFYPGQLALLMGPSGSGKSTLLSVLSGLLEPDSGEVITRDGKGTHSVWKMSANQREKFRRRNVGFIFQGFNLFPALNARQQLEIVLRWGEGVGGREARKRSDEMLASLGLGNKGKLLPSELSGGEKQRVAIGRALIKRPTFCFADEPTSALDWKHGENVIELLRTAAHERGATILIVSHDARIRPYADAMFYLEDGCLVDEPLQATEQPRVRSQAV